MIVALTREGAIAQLVEQRTENPCVPSSILGGTTKNDLLGRFLLFTPYTYTFLPCSVITTICGVAPNRNENVPPMPSETIR